MVLKRYSALILIALSLLIINGCTDDVDDPIILSESQRVKNADNNIAQDWYNLYLDIEKDLKNFRPNPTTRALAYIGMAAYQTALPGMPDYKSISNILPTFTPSTVDAASQQYWSQQISGEMFWVAALNQSYKLSLEHFLYSMNEEHKTKVEALYKKYETQVSSALKAGDYQRAVQHGTVVTNDVIKYAVSDREAEIQLRFTEPDSYQAPTGPGKWKPTAPDFSNACHPYWKLVRTFLAPKDRITSIAPPDYSEEKTSKIYKEALEVNEVINNLTEEDKWIAEFWSDDLVGITFSPPARQVAIANQLIGLENSNLETSLHLYLKLGIVLNDAAVICWKAKYDFNLERPVDYIRRLINPDFTPILGHAQGVTGLNPNFPAYPSGHSTFASAGAAVFKEFYNTMQFTDRCHEQATLFRGAARTFANFDEMAKENAFSRVPLGVHFRMDCSEGLRLGYVVGGYITDYSFKN